MLPQAQDVTALATGVAVGPDVIVALGQRACERLTNDDLGRCWGQPWVSTDGVSWEAVEARGSGLDLGRFTAVTSGPEIGVEGVAYGPGGFVAFGWARSGDRLSPTLWRSADGRSWERVPAPQGFEAEGLMMPGPSLHAIAGSDDGYLLGGTIYAKPAARAAIWSSPDGSTWTLAQGDEVFDAGAYFDTMETPAAGGVSAVATAPSGVGGAWSAVAVGCVNPPGEPGAGPKGESSRAYDWTTGNCRAQAWRSSDGLAWERLDLPKGYLRAASVATDGRQVIIGATSVEGRKEVISTANGIDWAANGGQAGRLVALAAVGDGFRALVPRCLTEECRRRSLELWSSADGVSWGLDPVQPTMPEGVEDFLDTDMAPFGDRVVATAGYWTAPRTDLASMALLSPALTAPVSVSLPTQPPASMPPDPAPTESPSGEAMVVTLPPADAGPLPDSVATPAGRIAYVTGAETVDPQIRILDTATGRDRVLADGSEPSWAPDGTRLAHDCDARGRDVTTSAICITELAGTESARTIPRGWGPRWSPDGASLAYSRSRVDMGDAWVQDVAAGASTALPGADPVWSPTGEWLMVTTGSGVPYVTVVRPDGSDERVLGPGWSATWSPDGSRIASAWTVDEGTTVSAVDVSTGATEPLFQVEGSILAMAWLPGDVMVIVDGGSDGGNLHAVDLADGSARSLTSAITFAPSSELAVSPDSRWFAFGATGPGGPGIYLASVDGGWRQLTDRGTASMPAWAP
jgi:Tol biopolymer transport system component